MCLRKKMELCGVWTVVDNTKQYTYFLRCFASNSFPGFSLQPSGGSSLRGTIKVKKYRNK